MPGFTVGTYDVGADNKANLIAAINAKNGTDYSLDEYAFTDPKRVTIPQPQFNTSIKLGPLAATGKIGFKTIYYNRIHADEIGPLKITWQNEQYLTELLPRLSEKYGIAITPDDVYEQVIVPPTPPETEVSLTLNFKETSVAYYGGSVIVLGGNDPSLEFETPEVLPFKNDLVFFVNNFTKTKKGYYYLESSVLGIASDRLRSRTMNVTNLDTAPYVSIVKNTYTEEQVKNLEQYLPFVFSWTVGDSKTVRGVNIYGDVVEINETSNLLEKKSSVVSVNPLSQADLTNARTRILVREGTQAADGSIYFLVGDPATATVKLMKSTDYGDNFTEVIVDKVNRAAFNYADWEDVVIHDLMMIDNKLSILVTNPNTYGVHPSKPSNGPAVEEYNLSNGTSDYFPINPEFVTNTNFSLVFNKESNIRFVTPETSEAILDVVAIARTSHTLERVVAYFHRKDALEYTAEVLGAKYLDHAINGFAAWSKPLVKDNTGKFVSIELLTYVPATKMDDYFLVETGVRGENFDMGHGIVTISGIRKDDRIGGWSDNFLDLQGGTAPRYVTVTDNGKRNHYVFSGGNGIFRTKYSESTANVYVPSLVKVFDAGSHPGFNVECDIGNGTFVTPEVIENPLFVPVYNDYPDGESLKPSIGFSFVAKNKVTNQRIWLVSPNDSTALQERTFSDEYRLIGKIPVAVYSDAAQNIYAVTEYQGIYKSSDQGNSWTDFSAMKGYYSNPNYIGKAIIDYKPQDFKSLSVQGDITYLEVNPDRILEVFKIDDLDPDYSLHLEDKVIYRIDATKPSGDDEINSAYITTSLNSTSEFSPRKTISWDTDHNNNIRALVKFTEEGVESTLDQLQLPAAIVDKVDQVYSDVGFFDLKAVAITSDPTDGAELFLVQEDDNLVRFGLQFSDTPDFPNFSPKYILPLWDGNDSGLSYTPIIVTSDQFDVLILERDGLAGGNMTINIQTLTVPNDNTKPLQWLPMFSSNRRDRFVFQEDNGIFRVTYTWDGANTRSVIGLVKIFDTSTLNISEVYSGCEYNLPNVTPYDESEIGPWPAYGTVLANDCKDYNKRNKIADGFGGYFWKVVEVNSADCGYVVPIAGDTGLGGGNFNIG